MLIDVHGHLAPYGEQGGGPPSLRDPEAALEAKLDLGIDLTIIGSPAGPGTMMPGDGPGSSPDRYCADAIRAHNELMGDLVSRFPALLRAYAYLDPFAGPAMFAQAEDLLADWRFVGVMVNTSVRGELLGSPGSAPFFEWLDHMGVPALLHPPANPIGTASLPAPGLVEHVVRPCDITMSVASIVFGGWLERYPRLTLIAAAGGGAIGVLAEKMDLAARTSLRAAGEPPATLPSESLRRIYVECSAPSPRQLALNIDLLGASHVLLGTDCPPVVEAAAAVVDMVRDLPACQREAVGRANAEHLFDLASSRARPAPIPALAS
jgi:aminocarboxymuconate-semialdehyde decarboxylase